MIYIGEEFSEVGFTLFFHRRGDCYVTLFCVGYEGWLSF